MALSEEDLKVLLANRDRGKGVVDRTRAVVGVPISERSGATPDSPPSRVGVKPVSSPAPFPIKPFSLTVMGQVPSGKNQVQLLWRNGKVHRYPNKTFTNWRARAFQQILEEPDWGRRRIITQPVRLTCEYWRRDQRTRDISGQLDAIFSLLTYTKILKDDGLVREVVWTCHPINRKFPKLVLTIEAYIEKEP